MFEEGRFNSIGTIHARCAVHYFGVEPARERLCLPCTELDSAGLEQLVADMREGAKHEILPGLAKAGADDSEQEDTRKSS